MAESTADDEGSLGSVLRELVATPGDGEAAPLVPGAVVGGKYHIERALGVGGMGVVYLARDVRLGRKVALKLGHILSREALIRTEREGVALAQLSHPNVVVVHEVGDVDGRLFIAMEYVAGGNAREWVGAAPRAWQQIALLYAAAGDGLAAAHAAGFVHRDFKPDNVLVGTDGRPRVADFGLVRSGQSGQPDAAAPPLAASPTWAAALESSTRTGTVLGTPAYMAPEQVAGAAVGPAADQYAFCASLWEALYGARFPAIARRGVPRTMERILRRGLARDPAARWPSMHELVAAIRGATRRRRRGPLALAIAAAALLAAGGAVLASRGSSNAPAPAAAPSCAPLAAGAHDVYVDARATPGGTGTARCPVRTITAALALAPAGPRTIHVAAGTYDVALGERFPLIVRGDTAIVGAGDDATRVVGTGRYDHRLEGGTVDYVARVTFLVGDERGTVSLAKLSIQAEQAQPEASVIGVFCDRGNLSPRDPNVKPIPAENTLLSELTIGPGYQQAVIVGRTARPVPMGCNLALTASTVHGSYEGVWVAGCGGGDGPRVPVRAAIGDGTDDGRNLFTSIRSPEHSGLGVDVWDCAREVAIRDNWFNDSDAGVGIVRHDDPRNQIESAFAIDGNQFRSLSRFGVALDRAAIVASLDDNWFFEIAARPAPRSAAERAIALVLDVDNERPPAFPVIQHARRNAFSSNDVAIEVRGETVAVGGPKLLADFGTRADPGGNAFRCNGTAPGASVPGYDLLVTAGSDGSGTLSLVGDEWDHAPPAIVRGDAPNGADVALPRGPAPALDLAGARTGELGCGSRAAGPPR